MGGVAKPYIILYRDEFQDDDVFDEYCSMPNAVVSDDQMSVKFYTTN